MGFEMTRPSPSNAAEEAVLELLGNPASYGPAGAVREVKQHQTHAATVFLAGDRAYKVKRAVRYPFLDFSSADKRKAACEAELAINRQFAPQLYRRLVPITRQSNGSLALDGSGEVVEWALEMARFDEEKTLDRLATGGELDPGVVAKLGPAVSAMHERAERVEATPWIAALERYIHDNTTMFRRHHGLFPDDKVEDLERQSLAALRRLHPLLRARGEQGLVRRGHGDLHLGNIAVLDGEPVAFDALEFDALIASGDVLYDLAFLLMDLIDFGQVAAANQILNAYYSASRRDADYDGIAALPFFMSLRAAIRAMTTASRLDVSQASVARSAQTYFALGLKLLSQGKPRLVGIGGLSGAGKSSVARALAPALAPLPGALIFRSDVERKALYGADEDARLPADAYRTEASERVYQIVIDKAVRVTKAGHSAIVDAVFAQTHERTALEHAAARAGVDFRGLFLVADLATRVQRIGTRAADASDADAQIARMQERFVLGTMSWTRVEAAGSPAQTVANVRAAIP
jgi:aminoglycoside phosphotransferase family enzyme/predicted kinase